MKEQKKFWFSFNLYLWVCIFSVVGLIYFYFRRKGGKSDYIMREVVSINSLWGFNVETMEIFGFERIKGLPRWKYIEHLAKVQKEKGVEKLFGFDSILHDSRFYKLNSFIKSEDGQTLSYASIFKTKYRYEALETPVYCQLSEVSYGLDYTGVHSKARMRYLDYRDDNRYDERFMRYSFFDGYFYEFAMHNAWFHDLMSEGFGAYPTLLKELEELQVLSMPFREDVNHTSDWYDIKGNDRFVRFGWKEIERRHLHITGSYSVNVFKKDDNNTYATHWHRGIYIYGHFVPTERLFVYCDDNKGLIYFLSNGTRSSLCLSFKSKEIYARHKNVLVSIYDIFTEKAKERGQEVQEFKNKRIDLESFKGSYDKSLNNKLRVDTGYTSLDERMEIMQNGRP